MCYSDLTDTYIIYMWDYLWILYGTICIYVHIPSIHRNRKGNIKVDIIDDERKLKATVYVAFLCLKSGRNYAVKTGLIRAYMS